MLWLRLVGYRLWVGTAVTLGRENRENMNYMGLHGYFIQDLGSYKMAPEKCSQSTMTVLTATAQD